MRSRLGAVLRPLSAKSVRALRVGGRVGVAFWLLVLAPLAATLARDPGVVFVVNAAGVALLVVLETLWRASATTRPSPELDRWFGATRVTLVATLLAFVAVGAIAGLGAIDEAALMLAVQSAQTLLLIAPTTLARQAMTPRDDAPAQLRTYRLTLLSVGIAYAALAGLRFLATERAGDLVVPGVFLAMLVALAFMVKRPAPDACRECGATNGRTGSFCPACGAAG